MSLLIRCWVCSITVVALLAPVVAASQNRRSGKPNVVFIFSDQHRMASYPGEPHTSVIAPTLDLLSKEGATFTNAISNYPVCSPFRAMLLTARAPFKTGVVDNSITLPERGDSFGNVFQQAGYRTGYIGKWHLGRNDKPAPGRHGFEYFQPWTRTSNHMNSSYWDPDSARYVRWKEYNATKMIDQALTFLDRVKDGPFLVMVSVNPPHSNYFDAPKKYHELYKGRQLKRRPNVRDEVHPRFQAFARGNRTHDKVLAGYLAHISAIDHEISRVVDFLDKNGLSENTIFVYTTDHGEMLGSHGRMGKRQPFEESIRIPFVVRWKGKVKSGLRPETLIGAIDFLPTVAGLAGVSVAGDRDGQDLSGVLRGETIREPEYQPIMHMFRDLAGAPNHPAEIFRGIRTKRFMYATTREPFTLFDLEQDPYQLRNLIGDPAYKAHQQRLEALTGEWLKAWDDPFWNLHLRALERKK